MSPELETFSTNNNNNNDEGSDSYSLSIYRDITLMDLTESSHKLALAPLPARPPQCQCAPSRAPESDQDPPASELPLISDCPVAHSASATLRPGVLPVGPPGPGLSVLTADPVVVAEGLLVL